jgi:hypothetical protein
VKKKGVTRGWELMLSHDLQTGVSTGFYKATSRYNISTYLDHLKACIAHIGHPLLLPTIIFSHDMSNKIEGKHKKSRDWLQKLEHAVSLRTDFEEENGYLDKDGLVDLDSITRDIVECHAQLLWRRPSAYLDILDGFEEALGKFLSRLPDERLESIRMQQASTEDRIDLYRKKLKAMNIYCDVTLARLEAQRQAVSNINQYNPPSCQTMCSNRSSCMTLLPRKISN